MELFKRDLESLKKGRNFQKSNENLSSDNMEKIPTQESHEENQKDIPLPKAETPSPIKNINQEEDVWDKEWPFAHLEICLPEDEHEINEKENSSLSSSNSRLSSPVSTSSQIRCKSPRFTSNIVQINLKNVSYVHSMQQKLLNSKPREVRKMHVPRIPRQTATVQELINVYTSCSSTRTASRTARSLNAEPIVSMRRNSTNSRMPEKRLNRMSWQYLKFNSVRDYHHKNFINPSKLEERRRNEFDVFSEPNVSINSYKRIPN